MLLIVVDTLRTDHVGSLREHGGDAATPSPTPAIDRWASGAARFRRARTPASFTMPAVAGLMSGAYPDRCGVSAHEPGTTFSAWPGSTVAESAREAGLATAAVIANPWLARTGTGFDRGFDEFVRRYRRGQAAGSSGAAAVTDEAIRILESAGGRRLLLWAHYFDPHMPYEPPAGFAHAAGAPDSPSRVMSDFNDDARDLGRLYRGEGYSVAEIDHARRLYEGEVRYADHEIGRLLERLRTLGRENDTIVVIASDHGESLGEHGLYFAHDYTVYEELTRVPLLIRGPGVPAGMRDDHVSLLDVTPTLCRLAALPCANRFDGRDLFASDRPARTLFAAATPMRARGTAFDRLVVPGPAGRWTMALGERAKLIRIPTERGAEFENYDLAADPREVRNIGATAESDALAAELAAWTVAMEEARPPSPRQPRSRKQRRDNRALRSLGYLQ
ncbi:MAG: sulfatase-like hydrolase/transferase [Candidatus Binatia bacterium]